VGREDVGVPPASPRCVSGLITAFAGQRDAPRREATSPEASQTLVVLLRARISWLERALKAPLTYRASSGLARSTLSSSTRLSLKANWLAEFRAVKPGGARCWL
jgi:hypothetical protein